MKARGRNFTDFRTPPAFIARWLPIGVPVYQASGTDCDDSLRVMSTPLSLGRILT